MINYRKVLELHFDNVSQRTISSSIGHSRNTVSEVIKRAQSRGVQSLSDTMTNAWLEALLFPEKQAIEKGYYPLTGRRFIKNCKRRMLR
ncbi:hypothetical protein [Thalassobacillus sp. C254]|uniref:hypothetical protein n=1 Tax=Thalassobacillus sp. C254 TaxID=1225341 RepID=UPI0022B70C6C|nr:hypothetical protein [Thalassobacillus sp. C254]